jgi:hypothetical protein
MLQGPVDIRVLLWEWLWQQQEIKKNSRYWSKKDLSFCDWKIQTPFLQYLYLSLIIYSVRAHLLLINSQTYAVGTSCLVLIRGKVWDQIPITSGSLSVSCFLSRWLVVMYFLSTIFWYHGIPNYGILSILKVLSNFLFQYVFLLLQLHCLNANNYWFLLVGCMLNMLACILCRYRANWHIIDENFYCLQEVAILSVYHIYIIITNQKYAPVSALPVGCLPFSLVTKNRSFTELKKFQGHESHYISGKNPSCAAVCQVAWLFNEKDCFEPSIYVIDWIILNAYMFFR